MTVTTPSSPHDLQSLFDLALRLQEQQNENAHKMNAVLEELRKLRATMAADTKDPT
jgi:hypothetical protein